MNIDLYAPCSSAPEDAAWDQSQRRGHNPRFRRRSASLMLRVACRPALAVIIGSFSAQRLHSNPVGPTVTQGAATFTHQGSQFTIHTSDRTFINWQSFNIGVGQT